jgi:hypothetical protein
MSSLARPRGKLPSRVYWFRRGLVLVVALALVFGVGRLLGAGQGRDPGPGAEAAAPAAAHPSEATSPQPIGPMPLNAPRKRAQQPPAGEKAGDKAGDKAKVPLAQPTGDCAVDGVTVRASLEKAKAGADITIPLQLSGTQAACRFHVSSSTVVVKVVSGSDRIWSSQDCRRAIKPQDVVVRSAQPTTVTVSWSGRRSDDGCPGGTSWAMPGWYHAVTAAIGSEPSDTQFELTLPDRPVVIRTATAEPHPQEKAQEKAQKKGD